MTFEELVEKNYEYLVKEEHPTVAKADREWAIPSFYLSNIRQYAAAYARNGRDLATELRK